MSTVETPPANFPVTPASDHREPLGRGKTIQTAACLIIGWVFPFPFGKMGFETHNIR